jgi:hypothetical protein
MSEDVLRIEKLENGFEVKVFDDKIEAANRKSKNCSYSSPWKEYAFSTSKEVIGFITKHIESLPKSSEEDFAEAANEAFKEK